MPLCRTDDSRELILPAAIQRIPCTAAQQGTVPVHSQKDAPSVLNNPVNSRQKKRPPCFPFQERQLPGQPDQGFPHPSEAFKGHIHGHGAVGADHDTPAPVFLHQGPGECLNLFFAGALPIG